MSAPKEKRYSLRSWGKAQHHPAGGGAFLFNLGHHDGANLSRVGHMRAAAGLQVDQRCTAFAADPNGADAPRAPGRLHAHAFDQGGVGVQLLIADRRYGERVGRRHQRGDGGGELLFVQRVGHRKVQPGVVGRDGAAIDQLRHHVTQQVRGGVQPHHAVAAFPIDAGGDGSTGRELHQAVFLPGGGDVDDVAGGVAIGIFALAGVGNGDLRAVCQHQHAAVAGLAAAQGVEHGLVQHDPGIGDGGDVGAAFAQVGVLAEEVVGHGVISIVRIRSSLSTSCVWEIAYADYTPEAQELAQFSRS